MNPDSARLHDFALRYTDAWCSRNPGRVAEFFSPNGSLAVNDGPPAVGRDAITEVAHGFMREFPDLHLTMDDLRVDADPIEYHWTLSGTSGEAKVRISGFEAWTFGADGLIAISKGYFDAADYDRQMNSASA